MGCLMVMAHMVIHNGKLFYTAGFSTKTAVNIDVREGI